MWGYCVQAPEVFGLKTAFVEEDFEVLKDFLKAKANTLHPPALLIVDMNIMVKYHLQFLA